jgi:hypothetical protein
MLQEPMVTMTRKDTDQVFTEMIINLIDVKLIVYSWMYKIEKGCAE